MAIYMSGNLDVTPPALLYNLQYNRVVHQHVVLLTVITEEVASVPPEARIELQQIDACCWRMVARYGFTETPDVPALLRQSGLPGYMADHTTFFLGRETVLATRRAGMALWREKLFAYLSRNAQPATAFFGIPPERVIEIGAQVEI